MTREQKSDAQCNRQPSPTALLFVALARKLRVMNGLRDIGFAITSAQYDSMAPEGVISRLVAMTQPAMATAIASYLDLDPSIQAFARASQAVAHVQQQHSNTDANLY